MVPGMGRAKPPFRMVGAAMSDFNMEALKVGEASLQNQQYGCGGRANAGLTSLWMVSCPQSLWWRCTQGAKHIRSGDPKEMSLIQFRMFMQEQFHVSYTMLPIVNRVFDVLDVDGGGTLSWQVTTCRAGGHVVSAETPNRNVS